VGFRVSGLGSVTWGGDFGVTGANYRQLTVRFQDRPGETPYTLRTKPLNTLEKSCNEWAAFGISSSE
jgi:hypothetical protein